MAKKQKQAKTKPSASGDGAAPATGGETYLGLARKWRPQRFEDLVGQDIVTQSLGNALAENRLVQAHILSGPRGVGKTTSARILARALNCEQGPTAVPCGECRACVEIAAGHDLDVIEIDAASNTGVDNMRDLLEGVVRAPFSLRFKVYIIDEVHMLSTGAFNALLKTLEEPPSHVVFVFATTELEKIPETIRSRCILHPFRRLNAEDIMLRLQQVADGEGIKLKKAEAQEIFGLIAQAVDGGMRDALVAFDQVLAATGGKPNAEVAQQVLGLSSRSVLADTIALIAARDAQALIETVDELVQQGRSLERFVKGLLAYLHDVMILQAAPASRTVSLTGDELERARKLASELSQPMVFNLMNQLFELEERLKASTQARFLVEFTFLRMVATEPIVPIDDLVRRIEALPENPGGSAPKPSRGTRSAAPEPSIPARSERPSAAPVSQPQASARVSQAQPQASAALVMNDSAGATVEPPPVSSAGPNPLAGMDGDELLELVVPQLPDTQQYLGRYLRHANTIRVEGSTFWVQWAKDDKVGSTIFGQNGNKEALEATLSQVAQTPMSVQFEFSSQATPRPAAPAAQAPSTAPSRAPVMNDSAPAALIDEAIPGPPLSHYEEPPTEVSFGGQPSYSRPVGPERPEARPAANASVDTAPKVTAEATRKLLDGDKDFSRRARMVRDFFEGEFVENSGRSISV